MSQIKLSAVDVYRAMVVDGQGAGVDPQSTGSDVRYRTRSRDRRRAAIAANNHALAGDSSTVFDCQRPLSVVADLERTRIEITEPPLTVRVPLPVSPTLSVMFRKPVTDPPAFTFSTPVPS